MLLSILLVVDFPVSFTDPATPVWFSRFEGIREVFVPWDILQLFLAQDQDLFDALLRPPIENPDVTSIQFVLDESERERWNTRVKPKVQECTGAETVQEPVWCVLDDNVSFILRGTENEQTDALLSFWGEPFMARTTKDVPRYIIHVSRESELIPQLQDIERDYRLQRN